MTIPQDDRKPVPAAIIQRALEAARKVMDLVNAPRPKGGVPQLQAKLQCLLAEELFSFVRPTNGPDEKAFEKWAISEGLIQESSGIRSVNSMCDVARKAYQAGRAAPDKWHDAALTECMRVESCYVKDDPVKTLQNLITWHASTAAPVPETPETIKLLREIKQLDIHQYIATGGFFLSQPLRDKLHRQLQLTESDVSPPAMPEGSIRALHAAVSALYFDNGSDYKRTLWSVIFLLDSQLAKEAFRNPTDAYKKILDMIATIDKDDLSTITK